ncbi:MAG: DUF4412 domain-containing protein [Acidobacteriia bacterium]|nr:DUF4412 domain-containing protein [Terriglobia bacterium]
MKPRFFVRVLFVAALALGWGVGTAQAGQAKEIELVMKDGGSRLAVLRLNEKNLLIEFNDRTDSALFGPDALITINHKDKTYRAQSYDELLAAIAKYGKELGSARSELEIKLTDNVATISGFKVKEVIKLRRGKPEGELWVCKELTPLPLRAFAEKIRSILPADYWSRVNGNPGIVDLIGFYGVPLKIEAAGDSHFEAAAASIKDKEFSTETFQVPAGYRKVN